MTSDKAITLHSKAYRRWWTEVEGLNGHALVYKPSHNLKVLLVCRDFYFAGIKAFYGGNTLGFESDTHMTDFAQHIGTDRRRCVKSVEINTRWRDVIHQDLIARGTFICYPEEPRILESNPLEPFPALEEVKVVACVYPTMALAGCYAPDPKRQKHVEAAVRQAWSTGAGKLEVIFTKSHSGRCLCSERTSAT